MSHFLLEIEMILFIVSVRIKKRNEVAQIQIISDFKTLIPDLEKNCFPIGET